MIEYSIGFNTYKIEDVTIRQYYEIQDLVVRQDLQAKIEIVSKIADCPIEELKRLDKHQFIAIWDALVTNYLNISDSTSFHKSFIYKEQLYGFLDMSKITLGEFADMDLLRADPQSTKKLHVMMAILYRPSKQITKTWNIIEDYNSDTLMSRAEDFMDLSVKYATGALNFFSAVSKFYVETTLNSLTQISKTEMTLREQAIVDLASQLIIELQEVGIQSSTSALETILPKLNQLQELAQLEYSTISRTEDNNKKKKITLVDKLSSKIKDKIKWQ